MWARSILHGPGVCRHVFSGAPVARLSVDIVFSPLQAERRAQGIAPRLSAEKPVGFLGTTEDQSVAFCPNSKLLNQ